jgi:hypothetical protein
MFVVPQVAAFADPAVTNAAVRQLAAKVSDKATSVVTLRPDDRVFLRKMRLMRPFSRDDAN